MSKSSKEHSKQNGRFILQEVCSSQWEEEDGKGSSRALPSMYTAQLVFSLVPGAEK